MGENTTKSSRELPTQKVSEENIKKSLEENYGDLVFTATEFLTCDERNKSTVEGSTGTSDAATASGKKGGMFEYGTSNRTDFLGMIPHIAAGIEMTLKGDKDRAVTKKRRDTQEVSGPQKDEH